MQFYTLMYPTGFCKSNENGRIWSWELDLTDGRAHGLGSPIYVYRLNYHFGCNNNNNNNNNNKPLQASILSSCPCPADSFVEVFQACLLYTSDAADE